MLQTTLTNLRTFSFAFVMVAMLMVGTMTPVHSASAQEASLEQRAAMLEQINILMELIAQLMSQLQIMQGLEASVQDPTPAINNQEDYSEQADPIAEISFEDRDAYIHTVDNTGAEWGRFIIEFDITADDEDIWIKNSLYRIDDNHSSVNQAKKDQNLKFSVYKNGSRITSGFGEHYTFMQSGFVSDADEALPVTSEKNENYYVVKQGKTETFTVNIMFAVQESGTYKVKLETPLPIQTRTGKKSVLSFSEKIFVSDSLSLRSANDSFESDEDNDALQEQIDYLLGLVDNPSDVPSDSERKNASERELQAILNNLMQQIAQQQEEEPELVDGTESRDFWDIEYPTHVYTVGAYEGSYPDGDRHSFRYHPQGEITLNMNKQLGQSEDTMLILTSYEPVNWKLTGDAAEYVTRVFLSGYYDQEITGIGSDVAVVHMSHQSGDRQYFYAYDDDSANFRDLQEYVEDQSDEKINLYWASDYSLSTVNLGQKG